MIISGGMDKTMRIWNIKGENRHTSTDFNGWVSSLTLLKQGKENLVAVGKKSFLNSYFIIILNIITILINNK
jgi:WD40 repeat protein